MILNCITNIFRGIPDHNLRLGIMSKPVAFLTLA